MICVIALIVFGILGIFSASQRKIAAEAFDCVFRKITFRKCHTGLDIRLKGQITGSLMKKSPRTGRFIYKHFETISWIFTILLIASLAYSGYGLFNLLIFGNCNGQQGGFCPFDLHHDAAISQVGGGSCLVEDYESQETELIAPNLLFQKYMGPKDSKVDFVEFGCYSCQYTREAQDAVERVIEEYGDRIRFYYFHFPLENHEGSQMSAMAAECAREQGMFWEYHKKIFEMGVPDPEKLEKGAESLGMDMMLFNECLDSNSTWPSVEEDIGLGKESGLYGTPTFFINGEALVGPQKYSDFKNIIEKELKK